MTPAQEIPSPNIEQVLLLAGLYFLVLLPYYFGIRAESFLLKSRFIDRVRRCVENVDAQCVSVEDLVHHKEMVRKLEEAGGVRKGVAAIGAVSATIKEIREHNGLGRRIAATEHLIPMWRNFSEAISDTWLDALLVLSVGLLGYIVANKGVSDDPTVITYTALKKALYDMWLPFAEIVLMLMAVRTYTVLKKQTKAYEKELKLDESK